WRCARSPRGRARRAPGSGSGGGAAVPGRRSGRARARAGSVAPGAVRGKALDPAGADRPAGGALAERSSLAWCRSLLPLGVGRSSEVIVMRVSNRVRLAFLAALGSLALALPAASQAIVDLLARTGDHFGSTLVPAGDFDHDGTPDALVGVDQAYGRLRASYVQG